MQDRSRDRGIVNKVGYEDREVRKAECGLDDSKSLTLEGGEGALWLDICHFSAAAFCRVAFS
jgi:hypothetical protein